MTLKRSCRVKTTRYRISPTCLTKRPQPWRCSTTLSHKTQPTVTPPWKTSCQSMVGRIQKSRSSLTLLLFLFWPQSPKELAILFQAVFPCTCMRVSQAAKTWTMPGKLSKFRSSMTSSSPVTSKSRSAPLFNGQSKQVCSMTAWMTEKVCTFQSRKIGSTSFHLKTSPLSPRFWRVHRVLKWSSWHQANSPISVKYIQEWEE